jgi:ARC6-like, IMS domain
MTKFNIIFFLILLLITACNKQENITSGNNSNTECLKTPGTLSEFEEINLQETVTKSGQLTAGKYIGYTFEGKKGQKLNYNTPNNICLWIFQPDTKLLEGVELPIDGKYTVQITLPKGSSTFDLEMSLNNAFVTSNSNNKSSSNSNLIHSITQEEALDLVQRWYSAKPTIFDGGFHEELVAELATGELYNDKTQKGGSMDWLQENGCYYTYDYSNIDSVISFSNRGNRPSLIVKVSEKLTLNASPNTPIEADCIGIPKSYSKPVTYWFEKENNVWKIYNYDVE